MKFLIGILIILPSYLFGQFPDKPTISLYLNGSDYNKALFIDILKDKDEIKIVYTIRDSISRLFAPYFDQYFEKVRLLNNLDSIKLVKKEIDSIKKIYSFFRKDSTRFQVDIYKSYSEFINQILSSEECDLKPPTPYITADGMGVSFYIKTEHRVIKLNARSPDEKFYPLLNRLITETLNIGRNSGLQSFLSKNRTYGY